jgi:urease alpha subunit
MSYRMDRRAYAETFGPTVGDRPFIHQSFNAWNLSGI